MITETRQVFRDLLTDLQTAGESIYVNWSEHIARYVGIFS